MTEHANPNMPGPDGRHCCLGSIEPFAMIPNRGGINGRLVRCSTGVEEGTATRKQRDRANRRRAQSFGRVEFQRIDPQEAPHNVGCGPQKDRRRSTGEMGEVEGEKEVTRFSAPVEAPGFVLATMYLQVFGSPRQPS